MLFSKQDLRRLITSVLAAPAAGGAVVPPQYIGEGKN